MPELAKAYRPIIALVCAIWIVEALNLLLGRDLVAFGILPRSLSGLIGIPLAPLIHGGVWHAVSNTAPLLILGALLVTGSKAGFWPMTIGIALLSGFLVWVFARQAYHVGASGLVFGYFGALLARALIERSLISITIGALTVFLYGGLIWGVLPMRSYISFEAHLFGLLAGVMIVWVNHRVARTRTPQTSAD